jgi:ElaB/YqjD/DUF883 family membrane-anchored ribosome-binding protein
MSATSSETDGNPLSADLKRLRDDVASLTRTIASLTTGRAAEGLEAAHDTGEAFTRWSEEGIAALEQKIVERPLAAVAIALCAGLLLGKLTDRR